MFLLPLTTVRLAQYIMHSVGEKKPMNAVPIFFFLSVLQNAQRKCGDFPCVST